MTTTDERPTPAGASSMADAQPTPGTDLAPSMDRGALNHVPLDARIRYARELSYAGDMLPKALLRGGEVQVGKLLLLVETGGMLGIHPVAAINGIHVIEGKPTISPALMSAIVRRAGHKLRVRVSGTLAAGDLRAVAQLVRHDDPDWTYESTWDMPRGYRAGLLDSWERGTDGLWVGRARDRNSKPTPWEKYPEAMLKARAIGEVCREGAEEALCGVHYTPEELGANVTVEGEVISGGTLVEPAAPPPPTVDLGPLFHAALYGARSRLGLSEAIVALPADPPLARMVTTDDGRQMQWHDTARERLNALSVPDQDGVMHPAWDLMRAVAQPLPAVDPEPSSPRRDGEQPEPPPNPGPEMASDEQLTALAAAASARGFTERADRLEWLSEWAGNDLSTSRALTKVDASRILDGVRREDRERSARAVGGEDVVDAHVLPDREPVTF